jgi:hypothetical protein
MPAKNQTRRVAFSRGFTNVIDVEFANPGKASWERYDSPDSFQTMLAQRHLGAGWVQIKVREQGAKSSREAHITLDPAQAQELKKLLDASMGTVNGQEV